MSNISYHSVNYEELFLKHSDINAKHFILITSYIKNLKYLSLYKNHPYKCFQNLIEFNKKIINKFDDKSMLIFCNAFDEIYNIVFSKCYITDIKINNFTNAETIIIGVEKGKNYYSVIKFFNEIRNYIRQQQGNQCSKKLLIEYDNTHENKYIYFPVFPSSNINMNWFKNNYCYYNEYRINVSLILIKHYGFYCPFFFLNQIEKLN